MAKLSSFWSWVSSRFASQPKHRQQPERRQKSKADDEIVGLIVGNFNVILGVCFAGFLVTPVWWLGALALLNLIVGVCILWSGFKKYQWPLVVFHWEVIKAYVESEARKSR